MRIAALFNPDSNPIKEMIYIGERKLQKFEIFDPIKLNESKHELLNQWTLIIALVLFGIIFIAIIVFIKNKR